MAEGIVQGIINMFTAGLYHLFEQQLLYLYREQLLLEFSYEKPPDCLLTVEKVKERLIKDYKIDISTFSSWSKIEELRLVANTVKHADGGSCEKLKQKREDFFIDPRMQDYPFPSTIDTLSWPVYQPLAGERLYIRPEEFTKYVEVIKQFFEELVQDEINLSA